MKLIIDVPEEIIEYIKNNGCLSVIYTDEVAKAITNGIPVSTEGDLISREALKKACSEMVRGSNNSDFIPCPSWNNAMELIDNAPTVVTNKIEFKAYNDGFKDGVEQGIKLEKRSQGEWGEPFEENGKTFHECNHCHTSSELMLFDNFCPNCGAEMRNGGAK